MLTVGNSAAVVEELLGNGLLSCPGCVGRLGGHGHAARRRVFTAGRIAAGFRPRRSRCSSCGSTHVLLPSWLLLRRCDCTAVIGEMLARAARGEGFRSIAAASGVPQDTVRDRLRRFRASACGVRERFTRLARPAGGGPGAAGPGWPRCGRRGGRCRRRGGGRCGPLAWRSRCRRGGSPRWSRRGRCCPRPLRSGRFSRIGAALCPGVRLQREFPSDRGRLLPVTLGGPARAGTGERTERDDCGRGG